MNQLASVIELQTGNGQQTLASMVLERIKADIIRGDLKPGQKLKIADVSARYGVGVIPLREALSRLATSGFVDSRDQRGFTVREVSAFELRDITRVRLLIESAAFRESIEEGDYAWEARVVGSLHNVSRRSVYGDATQRKIDPQWEEAHDEFHSELLSGCKSPWLLKYAAELREQTTRYRHISAGARITPSRNVVQEHSAIVDAALSRKSDLAIALLSEHITTSALIALDEFPKGNVNSTINRDLRGHLPKSSSL